jgi:hypothetical protein
LQPCPFPHSWRTARSACVDPDLLAGFVLLSVRNLTELTIAGNTTAARPTGEQLWQLVARGVAR